MRKRFTILFLCFFPLTEGVFAQQMSFIKYSMQDGLIANPVRHIFQDKKGFIWFGSYEGLSRYDGYRFTNFNITNGLSHNLVNTICEIDNKILVGENDGSIDIIEGNNVRRVYKIKSAANHILKDGASAIITTDYSGFFRYNNGDVSKIKNVSDSLALGFIERYNDSFIIGGGVDDKIYVFTRDLDIYASLSRDFELYSYAVTRDSKGRFWACTSAGLYLIRMPRKKHETLEMEPLPKEFDLPQLKNTQVTSLVEEEDGSYWIGTQKGLVHIAANGNHRLFSEKDGLPSAFINVLYRDREQNLWIGTNQGIAKWVARNNTVLYNAGTEDFRPEVRAIHALSNNKMLLSTTKGLVQFNFDTKTFSSYWNNKYSFFVPVKNSSPLRLFCVDEISEYRERDNIAHTIQKLDTALYNVNDAIQHPSGIIFLTGEALMAIEKSKAKKLLPHRITAITIDNEGYIWAGTWMEGLYRIRIDKNSDSIHYEIKDVTGWVNSREIRALFVDSKKNIWVGTRYYGAFRLTDHGGGKFKVKHIDYENGLISNWVKCFWEAANGDIMLGTYLGIDRLVLDKDDYRVFNLSKVNNFFAQIEQIISPGNNYWACRVNTNFVYFKDESLHTSAPLQASLMLAHLGVGDDKKSIYSPARKVNLRPSQNAARFEFSALGFTNEKQVMYSYRLIGSGDTSWSKPENIHEASYESLSQGDYTFEVRTIGWNGVPGKVASFSFHIATPFWKQWWFIGLCAILLLGLIYAFYRYRIQQLLRLQRVRNSIATDLHDDIGSALTNISILAELSRNKNQEQAFTQSLPGKISEESALAQQALDDIIWSVNSKNDTLDQTMARMRRYAAEIFEPIGINCQLDFSNLTNDQKLNMEQRKDIYLVFKECLNNIIKHAEAKNVSITINIARNLFVLKIIDDGKGFDPSKATHRNGIKNIQERVNRWNGQLIIQSAPGKGSTIHCEFPLASPK